MAYITVQQLKTAVASIPAGANSWEIVIPDDLQPLTVETGRTAVAGGITYTTRGYVDLATLSWTAVP